MDSKHTASTSHTKVQSTNSAAKRPLKASTSAKKVTHTPSNVTTKKAVTQKAASKTSTPKSTPAKTPLNTKTVETTQKKVAETKKVSHQAMTDAATVVKVKKSKIIRDSFTIPKDEYQEIHTLKIRCAKIGIPAKKSELLRAGIKVLSLLSDSALEKAMGQIPLIKTGRPQKS